jgi:hypothetical protein
VNPGSIARLHDSSEVSGVQEAVGDAPPWHVWRVLQQGHTSEIAGASSPNTGSTPGGDGGLASGHMQEANSLCSRLTGVSQFPTNQVVECADEERGPRSSQNVNDWSGERLAYTADSAQ